MKRFAREKTDGGKRAVYRFQAETDHEENFLVFLDEAVGPRSKTTADACDLAAEMLSKRAEMIRASDAWRDEE